MQESTTDIKTIATLQVQMEQTQRDVSEVKGDVKSIKTSVETLKVQQIKMDNVFVTQEQYKADRRSDWVRNVMSALLGALLTGMVALIVFLLSGKTG
jgi:hypothetical protein